MEDKDLYRQLDELHTMIARSGMRDKDYRKASDIILRLKQIILQQPCDDDKPLRENCEYNAHDECDCIGKYCQHGEEK